MERDIQNPISREKITEITEFVSGKILSRLRKKITKDQKKSFNKQLETSIETELEETGAYGCYISQRGIPQPGLAEAFEHAGIKIDPVLPPCSIEVLYARDLGFIEINYSEKTILSSQEETGN